MGNIIMRAACFLTRASMKIISLILVVAFLSSGCAAMFHGTKETVYLRSEEPDTHFYCNQRDLGIGTSAQVTLAKSDLSSSNLRVEKQGCSTKTAPIDTQFDAVTLLGILIDWGLISILIVDWGATGAVTKAAHNDYLLTPECPKTQLSPVQQTQKQPI